MRPALTRDRLDQAPPLPTAVRLPQPGRKLQVARRDGIWHLGAVTTPPNVGVPLTTLALQGLLRTLGLSRRMWLAIESQGPAVATAILQEGLRLYTQGNKTLQVWQGAGTIERIESHSFQSPDIASLERRMLGLAKVCKAELFRVTTPWGATWVMERAMGTAFGIGVAVIEPSAGGRIHVLAVVTQPSTGLLLPLDAVAAQAGVWHAGESPKAVNDRILDAMQAAWGRHRTGNVLAGWETWVGHTAVREGTGPLRAWALPTTLRGRLLALCPREQNKLHYVGFHAARLLLRRPNADAALHAWLKLTPPSPRA